MSGMDVYQRALIEKLHAGVTALQALSSTVEGLRRDLERRADPGAELAAEDAAAAPVLALAYALATFPWSSGREPIGGSDLIDALSPVARPFLRAVEAAGFVLPATWREEDEDAGLRDDAWRQERAEDEGLGDLVAALMATGLDHETAYARARASVAANGADDGHA